MLGVVFWHTAKSKPGIIPVSSDTAIKVATSGGTVIGQVGFGILADILGRKKMYGLELILIIIATLAVGCHTLKPLLHNTDSLKATGFLVLLGTSCWSITCSCRESAKLTVKSRSNPFRHHLPPCPLSVY